MTNEEFSSLLHNEITVNKLSKATSGLVNFTDSELFWVSFYTGIDANSIEEDDTKVFIEKNNLYKDSRRFREGKTIAQILDGDEIPPDLSKRMEVLKASFPLVSDEKSLKTNSFKAALSLIGKTEFLDKETLDEIVQLLKSSLSEGATEAAYANILSALELYFTIQSFGMTKNEMLALSQKKPSSELDISKKVNESIKKDTATKQKKAFFEEYWELFDQSFEKLFKSRKYKDLADYFWYIKYAYKIINPDVLKLTDEEHCLLGEHFLLYLYSKGNKYAKNIMKIFD